MTKELLVGKFGCLGEYIDCHRRVLQGTFIYLSKFVDNVG